MKIIRKRRSCLIIKTIGILVINSFYHYKKNVKRKGRVDFLYTKKVVVYVQANRISMNKKVRDYVQSIGLLSIRKSVIMFKLIGSLYPRKDVSIW